MEIALMNDQIPHQGAADKAVLGQGEHENGFHPRIQTLIQLGYMGLVIKIRTVAQTPQQLPRSYRLAKRNRQSLIVFHAHIR